MKKKRLTKINKSKSWFFEKTETNHQPDSSRKKGRRIKSNKLEMKMEKSQPTTQKYKGSYETTISNYMPKKIDNLEEMDKVLEKYNLTKLSQEETENLNRPIISMEIEIVIKSLPTNKSPGPDGFTGEFYQKVREELTPILLKLFQKIVEESKLPNSFYEASITLILKPKMPQKTNYRPISLMNTHAKMVHKILADRIQQHIKKITHHKQVGFIPGCKGSSIFIN